MSPAQKQPGVEIGSRLRLLRESRNLTQIDLGERLKLNKNTVGKIERGEQTINLDQLELIASFYDMSVVDVLSFGPESFESKVSEPKSDYGKAHYAHEVIIRLEGNDHQFIQKLSKLFNESSGTVKTFNPANETLETTVNKEEI